MWGTQDGHGVQRDDPAVGPWCSQHMGQVLCLQPGKQESGEADRLRATGRG